MSWSQRMAALQRCAMPAANRADSANRQADGANGTIGTIGTAPPSPAPGPARNLSALLAQRVVAVPPCPATIPQASAFSLTRDLVGASRRHHFDDNRLARLGHELIIRIPFFGEQ